MLIRYPLICIIVTVLFIGIYTHSNLSLNQIEEIIPLNLEQKEDTNQTIQLNNSDIKRSLFMASMSINNIISQEKSNKEELSPDDPEINEHFMKVSNVPYKANHDSLIPKTPSKFWNDNSGDCDDKSVAFADYLYKRGAKDIWIVTINHQSNQYSHSCVMWHNKIYDPTATSPIYNIDKEKYYDFLQENGFTLWTATTYTPDYITNEEKLAEEYGKK